MRCWFAQLLAALRDLALFNELEWLGLKFNALVVRCGCEELQD